MEQRIVLTGGPRTGKTSVLEELERRGHKVLREVAREVLREREGFQETVEEWSIRQTIIYERQNALERGLDGGRYFLDRGLVDPFAYCRKLIGSVPYAFDEESLKNLYEFVFILDRLPFQKDSERWEKGDSEAQEIHDLLYSEYLGFDYNPIRIPVFEAETDEEAVRLRTDFILKIVEGKND